MENAAKSVFKTTHTLQTIDNDLWEDITFNFEQPVSLLKGNYGS